MSGIRSAQQGYRGPGDGARGIGLVPRCPIASSRNSLTTGNHGKAIGV
jgi:hypothetical protein